VPDEDADEVGPLPRRFPWLLVLFWAAAIAVLGAVAYYFGADLFVAVPTATQTAGVEAGPFLTPSAIFTPTPEPTLPQPAPTYEFVNPTATPTPYPGGAIYDLAPGPADAGWVASDESRGNHLGDSYLYAGVLDRVIYHGVFQIDLSSVPRGATIHAAVLELTGLDDRRLGESGIWEVHILGRDMDEGWGRRGYQDVHNADSEWTVAPALGVGDLAEGTTHVFELSREMTQELERRLLDEHFTLSFRIDGPFAGDDSLFAWDTGSGAASKGARPRLLLNVGAPPRTPVPSGTPPFIVVTNTPTPANVVTAAAVVRTASAMAETTGQPTPTSVYEWTATPRIIVTSTPTPLNQATLEHNVAVITAVALTTGTTTPTPSHLVTATPTPLIHRAQDLTPAPPPTPTPLLPLGLQGRILFLSDRMEDTGPWVVDPDGGDVSVLAADWPYEVAASQETLSPDGRYVVYVGKVEGRSAVLIRPVGSREGSPLAVSDGGQFSSPAWSPTWNPIVFVFSAGQGSQIWVVNTDGTGMHRLTLSEWGDASRPTFSPDGTRLAYANDDGDGRRQLWVIDLNRTGRVDLSQNLYDEFDPVWVK
jgi:hypothetical protein